MPREMSDRKRAPTELSKNRHGREDHVGTESVEAVQNQTLRRAGDIAREQVFRSVLREGTSVAKGAQSSSISRVLSSQNTGTANGRHLLADCIFHVFGADLGQASLD